MDPALEVVAMNLARFFLRPQLEHCYLVQGSKVMGCSSLLLTRRSLSNCLFLSQSIKYNIVLALCTIQISKFD